MKTVFKFLALALFCSVAFTGRYASAATGVSFEVSPDDPNACFRSADKLTVKVGEDKNLPDCSVVSCSKTGENLSLQVRSCGSLVEPTEAGLKCKKITDATKPYPGCCPQLQCTKAE